MSWIRDPELFIYYQLEGRKHCVARIRKRYGVTVLESDIHVCGELNIAHYFACSYDNNKMAFDRFLNYLRNQNKYINSHGLAINYWVRNNHLEYYWSKEDASRMPHYCSPALPAAKQYELTTKAYACTNEWDQEIAGKLSMQKSVSELKAINLSLIGDLQRERIDYNALVNDRILDKTEKQTLVQRIFELEAKISISKEEAKRWYDEKYTLELRISSFKDEIASLKDKNKEMAEDLEIWIYEVSDLHEQLDREKKHNQALEKEVADLKLKLEQCCANGGESFYDYKEPWMNGYTVPCDWVPFEDLCVREFLRNGRPLTITKTVSGAPAFGEDYTTNVHVNYFYRGMLNKRGYPIVVVNVAELIPGKEKARFDPNIWSLFNNAGISYAARKPIESEMCPRNVDVLK